jgi:spermidine synthase
VAWIRRATLVFGSTTLATSTVLAVFFLGLALGSECFGRLSRRSTRPLLVYALLELGLAGLALASPLAFDLAERAYGWAYRSLGAGSAGLSLVRVVLVALVVLPPTWLMGGTLPLFCRGAVADAARIGRGIGALYALNTLGAAAGAAAAGFVLIPRLGVQGSIALGAAASAVAGIGVALARGRSRVPPLSPGSARWSGTAGAWVQLLFAGTGFVALGAEVLWTRYLALVVRNTVYTYTLTLSVTLLGIVVGSLIGASLADRVRRRGLLFGWLQVLNALALLGAMTLPPEVWHALGDAVVPYALLLLPPAALSGAAFPVATRMLVAEPALSGAGVGRMAAVNTLGGIAGSLTLGFVLLPGVGLAGSLRLLTGVALAVGLVAWWRFGGFDSRARLAGAAAAAALVWLLLPVAAGTRLPADFLGSRAALVDFREGLASNVAVLRERETLRLEIDRWWQGASRRNHQTTAAHLPMLLHPGARRVLVIRRLRADRVPLRRGLARGREGPAHLRGRPQSRRPCGAALRPDRDRGGAALPPGRRVVLHARVLRAGP